MRRWTDEKDLASILIARGNSGRPVRLNPDTAVFVGAKLMTAAEKPTRDEIARILCSSKCGKLCCTCIGKANVVVRAYGHRLDPPATS